MTRLDRWLKYSFFFFKWRVRMEWVWKTVKRTMYLFGCQWQSCPLRSPKWSYKWSHLHLGPLPELWQQVCWDLHPRRRRSGILQRDANNNTISSLPKPLSRKNDLEQLKNMWQRGPTDTSSRFFIKKHFNWNHKGLPAIGKFIMLFTHSYKRKSKIYLKIWSFVSRARKKSLELIDSVLWSTRKLRWKARRTPLTAQNPTSSNR